MTALMEERRERSAMTVLLEAALRATFQLENWPLMMRTPLRRVVVVEEGWSKLKLRLPPMVRVFPARSRVWYLPAVLLKVRPPMERLVSRKLVRSLGMEVDPVSVKLTVSKAEGAMLLSQLELV